MRGVPRSAEFPADRTGVAVQRTGKCPDAAGAVVFTGAVQFQHDDGPLFGAHMGVGSGLFHGNTSYEDGVLHLKVESKQTMSYISVLCSKSPLSFVTKDRYFRFVFHGEYGGYFVYTRMDYGDGFFCSPDGAVAFPELRMAFFSSVAKMGGVLFLYYRLGKKEGDDSAVKYMLGRVAGDEVDDVFVGRGGQVAVGRVYRLKER